MNELRRMVYLDALGIDSYVSRSQLPGAAPTRRLALASACVATGTDVADDAAGVETPTPPQTAKIRPGSNAVERNQRTVATAARTGDSLPRGAAAPGGVPPSEVAPSEVAPRFSLVAMVAGDWLWLEELAGMPLTTEQVQLVQSMAQALLLNRGSRTAGVNAETRPGMARPGAVRPVVEQFDWPIHTNHQLDLGAEAAQASVAGFVGRRLDQYGCRGLVLLGRSCAARLPLQEVNILTVSTASSAQILEQPALKRTVWRDLLPLVSTL